MEPKKQDPVHGYRSRLAVCLGHLEVYLEGLKDHDEECAVSIKKKLKEIWPIMEHAMEMLILLKEARDDLDSQLVDWHNSTDEQRDLRDRIEKLIAEIERQK